MPQYLPNPSLYGRLRLALRRRTLPLLPFRRHGIRWKADLRDTTIAASLYLCGGWEPDLIGAIGALGLSGTTCVDVGANVGVYTLALSRAAGPTGRVIALEPDPLTAGYLEENVSANGAANVRVLRVAAGASAETHAFFRDAKNLGNHSLVEHWARSGAQITVEVRTLDKLLADVTPGALGFAKIDVQGAELDVLRGMTGLVEANPRMLLQVELDWTASPRAVVEWLRERGFDGFEEYFGRLLPMQATECYEWPSENAATLIVSRDAERREAFRRAFLS